MSLGFCCMCMHLMRGMAQKILTRLSHIYKSLDLQPTWLNTRSSSVFEQYVQHKQKFIPDRLAMGNGCTRPIRLLQTFFPHSRTYGVQSRDLLFMKIVNTYNSPDVFTTTELKDDNCSICWGYWGWWVLECLPNYSYQAIAVTFEFRATIAHGNVDDLSRPPLPQTGTEYVSEAQMCNLQNLRCCQWQAKRSGKLHSETHFLAGCQSTHSKDGQPESPNLCSPNTLS